MIYITEIKVKSFSLDYLGLFWKVGPVVSSASDTTQHEIYNYDFFVLRSEAMMGPYEIVGGPFRDAYYFRDTSVLLRHKWRQYYYKIRIVDRRTAEVVEFGPASSSDPPPDLIAQEIVRIEDVLFREFTGRRCYLYPIRTFGPLCSCYDVVSGRKTRSGHAPCFGTGFLGGFMSPVEVYVQFDPNAKSTSLGIKEEVGSTTRCRLISFPPASPRDILIEAENRRWRVVSVETTERLRSTLHQELIVTEIDRGEIEYSLPINVDPASLEPAARRNFTNPHNIAEEDGEYSDIAAFFGDPRRSL